MQQKTFDKNVDSMPAYCAAVRLKQYNPSISPKFDVWP